MTDPTIAVLYDRGAASVGEISVGLAGLGTIVFLVADSAHTRRVAPLLAELGRVVPLTGDRPADLDRVRALAPAAVLTFSEPMLPAAAWLAASLGLPGHPVAATGWLTNKIRQRERLSAASVDQVRSRPVRSVVRWPAVRDFVGLPAVIKPVYGEGSRNTHVVRDDAAARNLLATLDAEVVVEELLVGRPSAPFGDYVSVESLCGPRGIHHIAVTGKFPLAPPFRETGRFWPAAIPAADHAVVTDLVTRALHALEVGVGLTHTEVKLTEAGPRIIEVNGRLGGHVNGLARQACGIDLVRLAGRLALGQDPDPPAEPARLDRVCFQHNTLAPVLACELVAIHGADRVRASRRVDGFRCYARPGDVFAADVMTRHIDLLWGACDDHAELPLVLDDALRELSYDFGFTDGVRRVAAADLQRGG
jgi:biotin carboxylase